MKELIEKLDLVKIKKLLELHWQSSGSTAGSKGLIPVRGTKIPYATAKTNSNELKKNFFLKLLLYKRQFQENYKTSYQVGENICKREIL